LKTYFHGRRIRKVGPAWFLKRHGKTRKGQVMDSKSFRKQTAEIKPGLFNTYEEPFSAEDTAPKRKGGTVLSRDGSKSRVSRLNRVRGSLLRSV